MDIRIVLLPPFRAREKAAKIAKEVIVKINQPTYFSVDNKKRIPHITLFSVELNQSKFKQYSSVLRECLKNTKSFLLEIGK